MKLSGLCVVIACASALLAATLSLAQVTYQNEQCFGTPVPPGQGQCGCPIANTATDFCSANIPPPGQTEITYYYCTTSSGFTCTSPNLSCGGAVLNCVNQDGTPCGCCFPSPGCPTSWGCTSACQPTDKKPFCGQLYGCTGTQP